MIYPHDGRCFFLFVRALFLVVFVGDGVEGIVIEAELFEISELREVVLFKENSVDVEVAVTEESGVGVGTDSIDFS